MVRSSMAPFHWPWTAPRHPHPRATWATLTINGLTIRLTPEGIHMSTIVNVGHNIALSIGYLDQNENPMLTPVTPDAPPGQSGWDSVAL